MNFYFRRILTGAVPLALMAASCGPESANTGTGKTLNPTTSVKDTALSLRSRQIAGVRNLESQLADTSGAAFAEAFAFPVPGEIFYPYVEQPAFRKSYETEGSRMTKDLFLRYFPEISSSLELAEFRELFRQNPPEKLQQSDSLYSRKRTAKEACFRYYLLQISGDELSVQYGSDHDADAPTEEDGEGIVCEWATIWTFRFDGEAWKFVKMFQAG